jgi:phosphatidate cytidylyltransferase
MRLLFVIVVAKASDMGGWLVGKPFGRTKILPGVSPGKSYEGGAGGLLASALCAVFLPGALGLDLEAGWSMAARAGFGVLLGAVSLLAGFCWSGFKRRIGTKHSSDLIPEMGGIMDLIDSLLLAGPTALVWYHLVA